MPRRSSLETEFQLPTGLLDPTFQSGLAVTRCVSAWNDSLKTNRDKNRPFGPALDRARSAYRKAMPQLVGYDNIRDFIACVAQGVLLGAISESESCARLFYAVQIAQGALRFQTRKSSA